MSEKTVAEHLSAQWAASDSTDPADLEQALREHADKLDQPATVLGADYHLEAAITEVAARVPEKTVAERLADLFERGKLTQPELEEECEQYANVLTKRLSEVPLAWRQAIGRLAPPPPPPVPQADRSHVDLTELYERGGAR